MLASVIRLFVSLPPGAISASAIGVLYVEPLDFTSGSGFLRCACRFAHILVFYTGHEINIPPG